jgi:hypothetical protein
VTKLVVVALVAVRLVKIAVTAFKRVAKRLVVVALVAFKFVTTSLVIVAFVIMVLEAFKVEALLIPVKLKLFKLFIDVVLTTPLTVLVSKLVAVAKELVLLLMIEVVAITPFTVELKVLPVTD